MCIACAMLCVDDLMKAHLLCMDSGNRGWVLDKLNLQQCSCKR